MSETLLDEVIEKHNYVVRVSTDPDDSLCVTVDFAGQKQAYYRVITDEEGETYGLAYWSSLMIPFVDEETGEAIGIEEFIPLNKIVARLYILCDIFRQCREMEFPPDIVKFYSSVGEKIDFMELIDINLDEEEVEVEKVLDACVSRVLEGDVPVGELTEALEKDGMIQSFNILRGLFI